VLSVGFLLLKGIEDMDKVQERITLIINVGWLSAHRVRMTLVLLFRGLAEAVAAGFRRVAAGIRKPRVMVATAVIFLAIATPLYMFLSERARRISLQEALEVENTLLRGDRSFLERALLQLMAERGRLQEILLDAGYPVMVDGEIRVKVTATGYSSSPLETDSSPFITASNTMARPGVIALSRDLLRAYNPSAPFDFGDRVILSGIGEFIVEDSMHHRWKRRVDIWFPSRLEALRFGRRKAYLMKPVATPVVSSASPVEGRGNKNPF